MQSMQSDSPHVNRRSFLKIGLGGAVGTLAALGSVSTADSQNTDPMKDRPEVLFFDVNETLLDLRRMKASVSEALGGRESLLPLWFTTMLQYSLVVTVADRYANFIDIGIATLQMVAGSNGIRLSEADARKAVEPMSSLPPHPEVSDALRSLKNAGYRMFTLTNSSKAGITTQMKNSGLGEFFAGLLDGGGDWNLQTGNACVSLGSKACRGKDTELHAYRRAWMGRRRRLVGRYAGCLPGTCGTATLSPRAGP